MIPLPRSFYEPTADVVARLLLGHWLVRNLPSGPCGGPIVETEAYLVDDPASHGFGGERKRNRPMYGPPGFAYVYLIYGFHCCMNAVCRPAGFAEAVLIRALEPQFGLDVMRANRISPTETGLTNGPGKLCAALKLNRDFTGADLCDANSPVFIARNSTVEKFREERGQVTASVRIGITKAAEMPLRFYLAGSPFISRRPRPGGAPSSE